MDFATYQRQFPDQNVSRETFLRLDTYVAHLLKWNPKINLIAKSATESEIWRRHILDGLQLTRHIPKGHRVLDLGSGGGIPGIILACAGYDVTLVESDQRKCIFLQEICRLCELPPAQILPARIEDIPPLLYDTITARALTSLTGLLTYAQPHLGISSQCLFPKGEQYRIELAEAREHWAMEVHEHPSLTSDKSVILQIRNISRSP